MKIITFFVFSGGFFAAPLLGVRESAWINLLGNENERVLQRTTSH